MSAEPRALARRLSAAVVTLMALSPVAITTAAPAEAYVPSTATVAAYEARVIYRMNVERVKFNRNKLAASYCPDKYAESWAAYLARTGRFYHRSMGPFLRGCSASRVAENLARGFTTADRTVAAWMASPGHRANILDNRLTRTGVAAVYARGQWTVVANFTRP